MHGILGIFFEKELVPQKVSWNLGIWIWILTPHFGRGEKVPQLAAENSLGHFYISEN